MEYWINMDGREQGKKVHPSKTSCSHSQWRVCVDGSHTTLSYLYFSHRCVDTCASHTKMLLFWRRHPRFLRLFFLLLLLLVLPSISWFFGLYFADDAHDWQRQVEKCHFIYNFLFMVLVQWDQCNMCRRLGELDFSVSRRNCVSWGAAGVILERRECTKLYCTFQGQVSWLGGGGGGGSWLKILDFP